jgi:hypothetical protein
VVAVITEQLSMSVEQFHRRSGWELKPEGACRGDQCVPLRGGGLDASGLVDVLAVADQLGMPVVADDAHGLWAVGPAAGAGRVLDSAVVPDLVLEDFDGRAYDLASSRGRKVLLLAWASW